MTDKTKRDRGPRQRPAFEDIKSTSTGGQSKPAWFDENKRQRSAERQRPSDRPRSTARQRSKPSQRPPDRRSGTRDGSTRSTREPRSRGRPAERGGPGARERSDSRRNPAPRKRKKPMSLFKRRLLIVLVMLMMLLGTGFLAESLLLRVTDIQVTGDQVYAEEDILKICGFKEGDNLLLIPASDRERRLESQLPYIAEASISRQIPGTVRIEITAARGVCCLESGGTWYVVAGDGKVLEASTSPKEGLTQVLGVTPLSAQVGEELQLDGEETSEVFLELVGAMDRLGEDGQSAAAEFTKMDLTNLYDIRLWYEDRVECIFGSAVQLERKLRWAYGNLTDKEDGIGREETGVLDLSYLPTKNRSYFAAGEATVPVQPTPAPDGTTPEGGGTSEGGGTAEGGSTGEPQATPAPGRGSDIPDSPFTG